MARPDATQAWDELEHKYIDEENKVRVSGQAHSVCVCVYICVCALARFFSWGVCMCERETDGDT